MGKVHNCFGLKYFSVLDWLNCLTQLSNREDQKAGSIFFFTFQYTKLSKA